MHRAPPLQPYPTNGMLNAIVLVMLPTTIRFDSLVATSPVQESMLTLEQYMQACLDQTQVETAQYIVLESLPPSGRGSNHETIRVSL